ncbi:dermonecrotic toxin domain-containing protein [Pseudomonas lini]
MAPPTTSAFDLEYRRESLTEPWRLMLKLQGEFAVLQRQIDVHGQQVLNIAIDANTREAFAAQGKRIVLLPAHLTVGGEDTQHQGPSTLTGVTFIQEQVSGLTLLYLPDSPDGLHLRQYDTLEQARQNLFNLCLHTNMVNYLAGRALHGDFALHVSRINQALLRNFDALIGVGMAWPATTSLAAHLLNVHMGRLLQAHRSTSRSNDALYLEHCALKSGAMFNYLKMALGMVPFVGTAIALYDAWGSANLAVAAFLRGDVGHGLAEVEAVLLSLIDAAMDILPGANAAPGAARAITRHRQLRTMARTAGALQASSRRQARRVLDYFHGYEYEHQISLAGLQPATHGIYRNVYRHADGDFMISQGRIYRIELSDAPRGWRLHGTWARAYKQPIALDEAGNWNTHYAVYGTLMEGGGVGGGAALGHLADGMDPLWPAAIRRWLPRWWTDRNLRRQLTLTNTADAYIRRLDTQTRRTNVAIDSYHASTPSQRQALRAPLESACAADIDAAQKLLPKPG